MVQQKILQFVALKLWDIALQQLIVQCVFPSDKMTFVVMVTIISTDKRVEWLWVNERTVSMGQNNLTNVRQIHDNGRPMGSF